MSQRKVSYGGQAVIEGVMLRGPDRYAVAVRRPDGNIGVVQEDLANASRKRFFQLPIVRGAVLFVETLTLGIKTLMLSADLAGEEQEKLTPAQISMTVVTAMAFAIGLFIVLPTVLMSLVRRHMHAPVFFMNVAEGLLRATVFVLYVFVISRIQDVQRVLEYHGAEHKAINAYDAGSVLSVENVRSQSRLHPRCGTSFLLFVVLIGSVLFSFFGWPNMIQRIAIRLALLPLVAGLSYEVIRLSGLSTHPVSEALKKPGLLFQRLTTREPDDKQIEVALAALSAVAGAKGGSGQNA